MSRDALGRLVTQAPSAWSVSRRCREVESERGARSRGHRGDGARPVAGRPWVADRRMTRLSRSRLMDSLVLVAEVGVRVRVSPAGQGWPAEPTGCLRTPDGSEPDPDPAFKSATAEQKHRRPRRGSSLRPTRASRAGRASPPHWRQGGVRLFSSHAAAATLKEPPLGDRRGLVLPVDRRRRLVAAKQARRRRMRASARPVPSLSRRRACGDKEGWRPARARALPLFAERATSGRREGGSG